MVFLDQFKDLLLDGSVKDIKTKRREIHTRAVEAVISARKPNRILGAIPPDVVEEEVEVSRGERTTLA